MKKNIVQINEETVRRIVTESVKIILKEHFKHFAWTDEDEQEFSRISNNEGNWTSFSWSVIKPSEIVGVPDTTVNINGEIYDALATVHPKYAHKGYGANVLCETYARNVTIKVMPTSKTRYSEYRKGEVYKLVKAKVLGGHRCEICGITTDGEFQNFRYQWK